MCDFVTGLEMTCEFQWDNQEMFHEKFSLLSGMKSAVQQEKSFNFPNRITPITLLAHYTFP